MISIRMYVSNSLQFQDYMKGKQLELDASKLRQFRARKKAMEEQRDIRLLDEELGMLRSEYAGLVKRYDTVIYDTVTLHCKNLYIYQSPKLQYT